jgi:hypothetical protein
MSGRDGPAPPMKRSMQQMGQYPGSHSMPGPDGPAPPMKRSMQQMGQYPGSHSMPGPDGPAPPMKRSMQQMGQYPGSHSMPGPDGFSSALPVSKLLLQNGWPQGSGSKSRHLQQNSESLGSYSMH